MPHSWASSRFVALVLFLLLFHSAFGFTPTPTNTILINGTTVATGTGASGAGTQRMVTSTDSTIGTVTTLSQFPATAALADATTNPTLTQIQVFPMLFGALSKWDRPVGAGAFSQSTLNGTLNSFTNTATGMPVSLAMGWDNTGAAQAYRALSVTANGYANVVFPSAQAVTQSSGPWTSNVTQFGGNNVATGTGASGVGIPRVTVANDSNILATQSGNWTARVVGNAGGIFDAAGQNVAQPANELLVGGEFNTTPTTILTGNMSPLQLDSKGSLRGVIEDAAGNIRGANVNASNQLSVSVDNNPVLGTGTNSIGTVQPGNTANTTPWLMKINDGSNSATVTTESLKVDLNRINGKTLNTYSTRITTATTVTPTAATAYISSIAITTEVAGAGSTITIRDKQGTPLVLVNSLSGAAVTASPIIINFANAPVQMVGGIDIITTSVTPATWDVFITYF